MRYLIGIDLGTTNTVLYYCELEQKNPQLQPFKIMQTVAPGEIQALPLLPSFVYLPDEREAEDRQLFIAVERASPLLRRRICPPLRRAVA